MPEEVIITEEAKVEVTPVVAYFDNWKTEPTVIATVVEEKEVEDVVPMVDVEAEEIPVADEVKVDVIAPEPIKFANEESEKVFNLLKEGKKEEVLSILNEQKKLSEVEKLSPADIIKLNLQYQHKDFTQIEINDLFEEQYEYPEKPVMGELDDEDEFKTRTEKYEKAVQKIDARITRDSKPAIAELQKLSKEIVLPEITKPETDVLEPTQEELDAHKKEVERFLKSVDESIASHNGYNATFKDEEVEIQVAYPLSKEEKEQIQPLIALSSLDAGAFLKGIGWINEKGEINAAKLAEDIPFILNKNSIINKMVSETGNKRYAEAKKSVRNIDYGGNKPGGSVGKSHLQLQGEMSDHFFDS
jgi:hypothetical protein